jgi:hypothetical protein
MSRYRSPLLLTERPSIWSTRRWKYTPVVLIVMPSCVSLPTLVLLATCTTDKGWEAARKNGARGSTRPAKSDQQHLQTADKQHQRHKEDASYEMLDLALHKRDIKERRKRECSNNNQKGYFSAVKDKRRSSWQGAQELLRKVLS